MRNDYDQEFYPAQVVRRYCWRRREYVEQAVGNLGRLPPVTPADPSAALTPEPRPPRSGTRSANLPEILAAILREESPLTTPEIVQRSGLNYNSVRGTLDRNPRFEVAGYLITQGQHGGTQKTLWQLAEDEPEE